MKKSRILAFTLAEVLITLGIIGIVAALTIPNLVGRYREKQKVSQLKKTYSAISQAFMMARVKHGDSRYWTIVSTDTGEKDENGDSILDYSGSVTALRYFAENLQTTKNTTNLKYIPSPLNSKSTKVSEVPPERYVRLTDGTSIVVGYMSGYYSTFDLMVLFPTCLKSTCHYGKDIFYFKVDLISGKIVPFGNGDAQLGIPTFEDKCNMTKENAQQGFGCTAWVLYKENMDYLHCNDLSWEGKSKCN